MGWIRRLLGYEQPRRSDVDRLVDHMRWHDDRVFAMLERSMGTVDRVVAAKFDRPEMGMVSVPRPMPSPLTPEDLMDVLTSDSDEEFERKVDQITH